MPIGLTRNTGRRSARMACPNRNRHRPRTVAFRLTDDEFVRIEQRIKVTGEVKGDFLREMALNGEIKVNVGKYKSDKLALAIRRLPEQIKHSLEYHDEKELLKHTFETKILLEELLDLMKFKKDEKIIV